MEMQPVTDPFERLLYFSLYFFTIHYCVTVVRVVQVFADDITVFSSLTVHLFHFPQRPLPGHGQGRLSVLDQPVTVATAIQKMKSHLGITHLRLALGLGKTLGNEQQAVVLII